MSQTATATKQHPTPRRRSRVDSIVRFIGIVGRIFVVAGLILLLYTSYLLWGTGVYTKQEQRRLEHELAANPTVTEQAILEQGGEIPAARPAQQPNLGDPLFSIKIPKVGLDTVVVFGVGVEELKKGPGIFAGCDQTTEECVAEPRFPGESGNVAVSGHRTTYDAPFWALNELEPGDVIDFVSGRARYRYKVREQQIVNPITGYSVVEQHGRDELTLVTCHPRFSAAQRLIVQADYEGASLIGGPTATGGPVASTEKQPVVPQDVLVLASIALASALGSLALSKRHRAKAAYAALFIASAAGLWVGVFPRVLAMMPTNY